MKQRFGEVRCRKFTYQMLENSKKMKPFKFLPANDCGDCKNYSSFKQHWHRARCSVRAALGLTHDGAHGVSRPPWPR